MKGSFTKKWAGDREILGLVWYPGLVPEESCYSHPRLEIEIQGSKVGPRRANPGEKAALRGAAFLAAL